MNFGPETKKNLLANIEPPKWIFGGDYVSCWPLKFLYAPEIDQALLALTQMGMASPKNFWSWKFKIWPEIQRISPYNFGSSGIYSQPDDVMNFGPQTKTL